MAVVAVAVATSGDVTNALLHFLQSSPLFFVKFALPLAKLHAALPNRCVFANKPSVAEFASAFVGDWGRHNVMPRCGEATSAVESIVVAALLRFATLFLASLVRDRIRLHFKITLLGMSKRERATASRLSSSASFRVEMQMQSI